MKTCFICNIEKPLENFYVHSRMNGGYQGKCKACVSIYNVKRRYNLSKQQFDDMLIKQNGTCAIQEHKGTI